MNKELMARVTMLLLLGCSVFFAIDVVVDVFSGESQTVIDRIYLVVETIATIAILISLVLLRDYVRVNRRQESEMQASLAQLKQGLSEFILNRIHALSLTPAETEVAILTIKGCSIAEIGALRGTSDGTVKAQQHAVYQKAGVTSRAELLLLCIEDAVEYSTEVESLG